jgi:hypothetical protein
LHKGAEIRALNYWQMIGNPNMNSTQKGYGLTIFNRHNLVWLAIALIICSLLYTGCTKTERINNSDRQKFIDIYVDLTLAYWNSAKSPVAYQSLAAAVFQKYNTDKSFLIKTQKKIENNPKLQYGIYLEIINRLKVYDNIPADSLNKAFKETIDLR